MTREEHLQWCKNRAIEYVDQGDTKNAIASFMSDMGKHEETRTHSVLPMMSMMMFGGQLSTTEDVRRFIKGFN